MPVQPRKPTAPLLNTNRDHLLIYAFSYSDSEFLENLKYFVQEAVQNDTVADYVIIVQEGPSLQVCLLTATVLPAPTHACHLEHHCMVQLPSARPSSYLSML